MDEYISVYSQNCQGLGNTHKRRDIFHYVRQKKYDIICLQDVHITKSLCSFVEAEWGNSIFICPFSSNSRGVMILFRNSFEYKVKNTYIDYLRGNYVIIDLAINEKKITLATLYGPNDDNPEFYESIFTKIHEINNDYTIVCGDWNMVVDPSLDTENYLHINSPRSRNVILNLISTGEYVDIWRVMHKKERQYTWKRGNPTRKQARLDFFLISKDTQNFIDENSIVAGYRSDHKGILLKLKVNDTIIGPGYWKFNNLLLKDEKYIKLVKNVLQNLLNQHRTVIDNTIDTGIEDYIDLNINDQLFLETYLVVLRGETIKFCSEKKKQLLKSEKYLENNIETLEKHVEQNYQSLGENLIIELENMKNELENLWKIKMEGIML